MPPRTRRRGGDGIGDGIGGGIGGGATVGLEERAKLEKLRREDPDFEELVKGMPKLKARRLRASLVELGARLA